MSKMNTKNSWWSSKDHAKFMEGLRKQNSKMKQERKPKCRKYKK